MDPVQSRAMALPHGAAHLIVATGVIAVLVTSASVLGLTAPWPYEQETENWVLQARGQDVGNLIAVVALSVGAIGMRTGSSAARQLWVGSLLYLLYAYAIYAFAVHFGRLFLVYIAILGLVAFALIATTVRGAPPPLRPRRAARTFGASVLILTGVLFALLWLSELIPATVSGEAPASLELAGLIVNPVHVIDLAVVLPGMIVIGVLAQRGHERGMRWLVPALTFSVLMGSSIIAAMVLIIMSGDPSGLAPLAMVAAVVAVSLAAALACAPRSAERG